MSSDTLEILRQGLSSSHFDLLMRLTDGGRCLPIGDDAEARTEAMLLHGGDEAIELLMEVQRLIGTPGLEPAPDLEPEPAPTRERLTFSFDIGSRQMEHFLGSLKRNGFESLVVEATVAHVYVYLYASSDYDFFHQRAIVASLLELSKLANGKNPKGHRLY